MITGKEGEGSLGTCIKDTWTKRVDLRVGGEDGWGRGKMETTVLEQQFLKKELLIVYKPLLYTFLGKDNYIPYFSDYKTHTPQIWEEGGASYSLNVA